jgi:CDP-diacylglycerol--glycerol-3-phosphate 3-phosphatidyltransferase
MNKRDFKNHTRRFMSPVVAAMTSLGIPPALVSVFGLVVSIYGAIVIARGSLVLGGVFLLLSGLCDVLDGDLARRRGLVSRFGAFLDSTLDRVSELAIFCGILYYVVDRPGGFSDFAFVVTFVALAGSVLTSYARARAEGLGYDCTVGIMERPERIAALTVGLLLGERFFAVLVIVLTLLSITTVYTFVQRILHVRRVSAADDRPLEPKEPTESADPAVPVPDTETADRPTE